MKSRLFVFSITVAVIGCSKEPAIVNHPPVTGKVTLNGKPLAGATVTFFPTQQNTGNLASGVTDDGGEYKLKGPRGGEGAGPGDYKVVISLWLQKDGKPPPPDVAPANSGALESIPATYSSQSNTTLQATVAQGGGKFDFPLRK